MTTFWVSGPIRPKLPLTARCFGQKVMPRRPLGFVKGVKGQEAKFLVSCNMVGEIDDLPTFSNSVKRPLVLMYMNNAYRFGDTKYNV